MAEINTSAFSTLITTLYEQRALIAASPRLLHSRWARAAQFVGHNVYQMYRYSEMTAQTTSLVEGDTPAESAAPTLTTVQMTPIPYGAWLGYTQDINLQAFSPVVSQVSQIMGRQAGLSVDTLVRTTLRSLTADYAGTGNAAIADIAAGDVISYDELVDQLAEMQVQNALPADGGSFVCILHPLSLAKLFKDTDFQTVFTREGGQAIRSGKVGQLFNCDFYVSSNALSFPIGTEGAVVAVYAAIFLGAEAYGMAGFSGFMPQMGGFEGAGEYDNMTGKTAAPVQIITRALGETGFDPLKQRGTIGWLLYEDDAILNANFGRVFYHAIA